MAATDRFRLIGAALALAALPACAGDGSLSFLVLGDWGWNGHNHQREIAQTLGKEAKSTGADFVVSLGDNFQVNGVRSVQDPLWRLNYEDIYTHPSLEKDWYCVLGNHDYHGNPQAEVDYTRVSRRWNMPARWYSVKKEVEGTGTTLEMFFLDTSPLQRKYWKEAGRYSDLAQQDTAAQLRWLDSSLAASKAAWKLVFGHHPVYSGGKHAPELADMPPRFAQRFEKAGVAAYFSGHDHHLEHVRQPGSRVHYFVDGAHEVRPVTPTPASDFAVSVPGFMAVSVGRDTLRVRALDEDGKLLREFAIPRTGS